MDAVPSEKSLDTAVGELSTSLVVDADLRRLTLVRSFTLDQVEVATEDYADLHRLWAETVAWDSETVVLVQE